MIEISRNMSVHQAAALAAGLGRPIIADGDRHAFYLQSNWDTGNESQSAHIERTQESKPCHAE